SAHSFFLDFTGDGLIHFEAQPGGWAGGDAGITQTEAGSIAAETVMISAHHAEGVLDQVINLDGVVSARSMASGGGRITLDAGAGSARIGGALDAGGDVAGEPGGSLRLSGAGILLRDGSTLRTSGAGGAGTIRIGDADSRQVFLDPGAAIENTQAPSAAPAVPGTVVLRGDAAGRLEHSPREHPVALQLGGSDPVDMARCAKMGRQWGYSEININVGCPSSRAGSGNFGACLFAQPKLLAECVAAMTEAAPVPVSIKTRLGIDELDSYEDLLRLVELTGQAGCRIFIIHARKALSRGLSPAQNRSVPPLDYERVSRLKGDFPHLTIVLNGGLTSHQQGLSVLEETDIDGVMFGRAPCADWWLLQQVDPLYFGEPPPMQSRSEAVAAVLEYLTDQCIRYGTSAARIARHLPGLWCAVPGARAMRRRLSENPERCPEILRDWLQSQSALQEPTLQ
ncbi:MAG: tRNA dihydrouridine(20/20a) synthase DusA, partial [Gammaproteobacteria bacterium AqS3]|nr:tRNA dihydrouridine(20/20a) synthase DusA [Gammaproteobacteria bacterium AqS3]